MNPAPREPDGHDQAVRLLPWFVNGTLAAADAQFVEAHLADCAHCRGDIAALAQVRSLLRSPDAVEHAPHGGLRKLMQRLDAQAGLPEPAADTRPRARRLPSAGHALRWLTAAVVVQSVALVLVGAAALRGQDRDEAAYSTLTAVPVTAGGAALRAVFASDMTLGEMQALLRAHRLVVRAGPSAAALFTLALQDGPPGEVEAVAARLRADPRVRFAEPVGAGAGGP